MFFINVEKSTKDQKTKKKEKPPRGGFSNQKAVLKKVCYAYVNKILNAFVTLHPDYFCTTK
jgi:hypothetical protein